MRARGGCKQELHTTTDDDDDDDDDVKNGMVHTASSTVPNSSNFWRRVDSSVCQARPLASMSDDDDGSGVRWRGFRTRGASGGQLGEEGKRRRGYSPYEELRHD